MSPKTKTKTNHGIAEGHMESEYDWLIRWLEVYAENVINPFGSYDKYRWSEPVRSSKIDFCCRKRCDSGHHKSLWKPHKSKPKENK